MLVIFASPYVSNIFWEDKTNKAGWIVLMFFPFFNFGKLYSDIALLTVGSYSYTSDTLIAGPGINKKKRKKGSSYLVTLNEMNALLPNSVMFSLLRMN